MSSEQELFHGAIHSAVVKNEEQDTMRVLDGHLHYAKVNRVKMQEEYLPQEERAKYEKRYRTHLTALAKLALDLSLEGITNVETNTTI
jgi:hypothetical protein